MSIAGHLVLAGINITTVMQLLGHKTLTVTLRYAHLAPSHKVNAVDVPDSMLNRKSSSQSAFVGACCAVGKSSTSKVPSLMPASDNRVAITFEKKEFPADGLPPEGKMRRSHQGPKKILDFRCSLANTVIMKARYSEI